MFWFLTTFSLIVILHFILIKHFKYWESKGVPQPKIVTLWIENVREILQLTPLPEIIESVYNRLGGDRYGVYYTFLTPTLFLKDPDLIKQITVKDFDHFLDHNLFIPEENEPLFGKNLFALKGDRWKHMRATLSPAFTSSKMRGMFNLMTECAEQFVRFFQDGNTGTVTVDLKDVFTRFANDVIASTAFGISCDSLKNRENEFYMMGQTATNLKGFWKNIKVLIVFTTPKLAKIFGLEMFDKCVSEFFTRLVKTNIQYREKNGIVRPDMIHLLIEAKKGRLKYEEPSNDIMDTGFAVIKESVVGSEENRQKKQLSDDDITAQALVFFFGGFETASSVMCFTAYELAVNPGVQKKLRDEVDNTLRNCNGSLTYEGLLQMKYMDMVMSESLRKWPPLISLNRVCVKPYTIKPTINEENPVHLNVGDVLWLPVYALHRDERFYSEPDRFDPDRFNDDNKAKINPYSYLPFGAGPRSCIASRFALMKIKTVLFYLLSKFEIVVVEKSQVPLKLGRTQFKLAAEDKLWFGFKSRKIT